MFYMFFHKVMWPHIWYPAHTYAYKLLWAFSSVPFSKYWEIEYFLHISKQGCHSHQWWQPSSVSCWALRELRTENTCRLAAIRPQPLLMVSPEERKLRKWKHRKLAPYSQGAYQRNDFSEPRLLHLLMFRKALNSLTWNIWFSLIYKKKAFDIYTTCLCCKTYVWPGFSPCLLGAVLSGSLEMLEVLKIPTFRNSQFLGCEFFLSQQHSLRNIIFHDSTTFILSLFYDLCSHPFLLGIWVVLIFYLFIH